jgi:hypothetical protein
MITCAEHENRRGAKFRLNLCDAFRARMNQKGGAGRLGGAVEKADERRVTVRFADGQPWQFLRREFEAAFDSDVGPMGEVWE